MIPAGKLAWNFSVFHFNVVMHVHLDDIRDLNKHRRISYNPGQNHWDNWRTVNPDIEFIFVN